ncbi:hypothetical protein L9F63_013553, partial [Diploptera punctata]
ISVSTLKSLVNINSRLFLFNKEFNDSALSKRNIDVCHFGNTACGHMIEAMTSQKYDPHTNTASPMCLHSVLDQMHFRRKWMKCIKFENPPIA